MTLEEQISQELSEKMSSAIDFEILSDILIRSCGWHKVEISRLQDNHHAIDIRLWCEKNIKNNFQNMGKTFLFKDQGDAVNFTLRWL
jgi:hypothetical protein